MLKHYDVLCKFEVMELFDEMVPVENRDMPIFTEELKIATLNLEKVPTDKQLDLVSRMFANSFANLSKQKLQLSELKIVEVKEETMPDKSGIFSPKEKT